jgi:hypothetical protein
VTGNHSLVRKKHTDSEDPEIWTISIDWAQLSRFYLNKETESSLRNVVFQINTGRWIMSGNIIFVFAFDFCSELQ